MAKQISPAKEALKGAAQSLLQAQADLKRSQSRLVANAAAIEALINALAGCENFSIGTYSGISVTAQLEKLEGFSDPRLCDVLERVLRMNPESTKTYDYPDYMNREYRFKLAGFGESISLCVNAYVKSDSPTCKKVLKSVSTRVVEDKVYELVCN